MIPGVALVWQTLPTDWAAQLAACLVQADERRDETTHVYFRADDVAVPGDQYRRMMERFHAHSVPLALAVVPAWLTPARWQALYRATRRGHELWCWHQHGWRHHNHEPQGKKQEFGPSRKAEALAADLVRGRRKLEKRMGKAFYPLFTPPWNRCSEATLAFLHQMEYKAVSRSRDGQPPAPPGLAEVPMDVDLHTARAPSAAAGWRTLTTQLKAGLARPTCGIMLHHRRMNAAAFAFLDALLAMLKDHGRVAIVDVRDLTTP